MRHSYLLGRNLISVLVLTSHINVSSLLGCALFKALNCFSFTYQFTTWLLVFMLVLFPQSPLLLKPAYYGPSNPLGCFYVNASQLKLLWYEWGNCTHCQFHLAYIIFVQQENALCVVESWNLLKPMLLI